MSIHMSGTTPRLKNTILAYPRQGEMVLRLGDELAEIEDPSGVIAELIELMNGERTYEQIFELLRLSHDLTQSAYADLMAAMDEYGFIEDSRFDNVTVLSRYERERWSRNIDFFGSYAHYQQDKHAYQRTLLDSHVALLGCGGLGTHILLDLAALGVGNITLVDFDKIELSNLNRQILYREHDIGSKKVFTAKANIQKFSEQLNVTAIERRLDSTATVREVIRGHDLVISVADKPRNRMVEWLNEACVAERIAFINGGLDVRRAIFYSVLPGRSGCVQCWRTATARSNPRASDILRLDKEFDKDFARPAPAMVPLVGVTAGCMVAEALRILTGIQPPALANKLKAYDFSSSDIGTVEHWDRDPACPVCGGVQGPAEAQAS